MTAFEFIVSATALLLMPGPTNTLLAAAGASEGVRRVWILPFVEALGYAFAVGGFVVASLLVASFSGAAIALRMTAAVWLLISAWKLWSIERGGYGSRPINAGRVFITTILNPKAMLVGTTFIPAVGASAPTIWILCYTTLSTLAGFMWMCIGSALPERIRLNSHRISALTLLGFAIFIIVLSFR